MKSITEALGTGINLVANTLKEPLQPAINVAVGLHNAILSMSDDTTAMRQELAETKERLAKLEPILDELGEFKDQLIERMDGVVGAVETLNEGIVSPLEGLANRIRWIPPFPQKANRQLPQSTGTETVATSSIKPETRTA